MRQGRSTHYVLYALCLGVLGAFLIWPIVLPVSAGFRTAGALGQREWTARYVVAVMQDPVIRDSLINSLLGRCPNRLQ